LIALVVLAAACGSGKDSGGSGGSGGSTSGGTSGSSAASAGSGTSASGGSAGHAATGGTSTGGSAASGGSGNQDAGGEAGERGQGGTPECAAETQEARLTAANLLFLIDKSGSMNCNPPEGDADVNARCAQFPIQEDPNVPSKWQVASDALGSALDSLSGLPNVSAGLTLFPVEDSCGVSATPAVEIAKLDADQRSAIADALSGVSPSGDTPLAGATILSYQHLSEVIRNHELGGNTFVVLLTDGAETCKESELTKLVEQDMPNARLFNIRTFVIGAPGSEAARSLLSEIAWVGGTATSDQCEHGGSKPDRGDCHFDMTTSQDFASDLRAALEAISRTKVLACEFDVPTNPDGNDVDRDKVNVTFTPGAGKTESISFDPSASCDQGDGWQYNDDRSKILLCEKTCERVQADPVGRVRIALGCPTMMVR
jgi:Mg-chelatase subunit ChlD